MEDFKAVELLHSLSDLNAHLTGTFNAHHVVIERREDIPEGSMEQFLDDDRLVLLIIHIIYLGSTGAYIFSSLYLS